MVQPYNKNNIYEVWIVINKHDDIEKIYDIEQEARAYQQKFAYSGYVQKLLVTLDVLEFWGWTINHNNNIVRKVVM